MLEINPYLNTFNKNVYLGRDQDALTQLNPMDMISFNWAQGNSYTMEATGYWSDLVTATTPATDAAIVFEKDNGDVVGFGLFYWRGTLFQIPRGKYFWCGESYPQQHWRRCTSVD